MKRLLISSLVGILALAHASCHRVHRPNLPWRTADPDTAKSANPDRKGCQVTTTTSLVLDDLANEPAQKTTRCVSHERYRAAEGHPAFDLHLVEFDDQGLFWNRDAVEKSLSEIESARARDNVVVVMFVHGWFNNADVCNGKLSCFRELLALIAAAEEQWVVRQRRAAEASKPVAARKEIRARRVIGVFAGWRGETIAVSGVKHIVTFWGRKGAAHTVGENGAVTELVARLSRIVRRQAGTPMTPVKDPEEVSSLVVVGHSFGGALLLSAIGNELSRAAGIALAQGTAGVIEGLADLVVLINPAVEASRFDNLRRAAANVDFRPEQLPLLLTLSSTADTPNKTLFPLGQAVAFAQKAARSREQWLSMIESLGTFVPNHTHLLMPVGPDPPRPSRTAGCQCEAGIREYGELLLDRFQEVHDSIELGSRAVPQLDVLSQGRRRDFLHSRLEPLQDADPDSPFMMVRVDKKIIGGHSDIFNQRTVDFVMEFFLLSELKRMTIQRRANANEAVP